MNALPDWNAQGIIPPVAADPASPVRSPYVVSLTDVILRFGTSADRKRVLDGFLRFRADLHNIGITNGLQWLDGSFLEDVETVESRSPRDIDIVTFFKSPPEVQNQRLLVARNPRLFDHGQVKADYLVDNYWVSMDQPGARLVTSTAYWYSLWSHRRNGVWKGFAQVDLDPASDAAAIQLLNSPTTPGVMP